jgi:hypothetical protein
VCRRSRTISGNNGTHAAGLLFVDNSTAELLSSYVSENYASSYGAGLALAGAARVSSQVTQRVVQGAKLVS